SIGGNGAQGGIGGGGAPGGNGAAGVDGQLGRSATGVVGGTATATGGLAGEGLTLTRVDATVGDIIGNNGVGHDLTLTGSADVVSGGIDAAGNLGSTAGTQTADAPSEQGPVTASQNAAVDNNGSVS